MSALRAQFRQAGAGRRAVVFVQGEGVVGGTIRELFRTLRRARDQDRHGPR